MEKKWEYAQSIHCLFVDFTKAYDSVGRGILFLVLKSFGVPDKLIAMIKVATQTSRLKVRVGKALTEEFEVVTGLKQGDALSPMLFNLILEYVIRKVLMHDGGVELNGKHKIIGYADDLALLGKCEEDIRVMAETLEAEGGGWVLESAWRKRSIC
ncbi:uncharacterized protein [Choristoneura fumiferana]|uniref:uncharacterized protein n=1 Tax=Choristoneura fumiferana TaxID=7141 RepID=UPI003D154777